MPWNTYIAWNQVSGKSTTWPEVAINSDVSGTDGEESSSGFEDVETTDEKEKELPKEKANVKKNKGNKKGRPNRPNTRASQRIQEQYKANDETMAASMTL